MLTIRSNHRGRTIGEARMEFAQGLCFGSHLLYFFCGVCIPCVWAKINHDPREGLGGVWLPRQIVWV
jgi:Ca2+/Na+ antiporter